MEVDGEGAAATGIVADVDNADIVFKEHKGHYPIPSITLI